MAGSLGFSLIAWSIRLPAWAISPTSARDSSNRQDRPIRRQGLSGRFDGGLGLIQLLHLHQIIDVSEPGLGKAGALFDRAAEFGPGLLLLPAGHIEPAQDQMIDITLGVREKLLSQRDPARDSLACASH